MGLVTRATWHADPVRLNGPDRERHLHEALLYCARAAGALKVNDDLLARGMWHNTLAMIFSSGIGVDAAQSVEEALEHMKAALALFIEVGATEVAAHARQNLANAWMEREIGSKTANIEQAIHHYRKAIDELQTGSPVWIVTQSNLANAYRQRKVGSKKENLSAAIECIVSAQKFVSESGDRESWADLENLLGLIYYERDRGEGDLKEALSHFESALEKTDPALYPRMWADLQNNISKALDEFRGGDRCARLNLAIEHLKRSLEVYTVAEFPMDHLTIQRALGEKLVRCKRWREAHEALEGVIGVTRSRLASAFTWAGRQLELDEASPVFFLDAYCLVQLGQYEAALARCEEGKERLRNETAWFVNGHGLTAEQTKELRDAYDRVRQLEAEDRESSRGSDVRTQLEGARRLREARANLDEMVGRKFPERTSKELLEPRVLISSVREGTVLIVPIVTRVGTSVFVIPHGTGTLAKDHVVELESFKSEDLQSRMRTSGRDAWLHAYRRGSDDPSAWRSAIENTCAWLWDAFVGPLEERVKLLGGASEIVFVPHNLLGLLPIHAAFDGRRESKRYLLDNYAVSYVASIRSLAATPPTLAGQRGAGSVVAFLDPTGELPYATAEGEMIVGLFDRTRSKAFVATPEEVIDAVRGFDYVHFCCHGRFSWGDPSLSYLQVSDAPLTLSDVLARVDLSGVRLTVLSACETGLIDVVDAPEESLGLTSGFLQAGSSGVLSSLWPVDDVATMLLMQQFYSLHLSGLSPAAALCNAQRWLREARNADVAEVIRRIRSEDAGNLDSSLREQYVRFALASDSQERPFLHPYYWAAFSLHGV